MKRLVIWIGVALLPTAMLACKQEATSDADHLASAAKQIESAVPLDKDTKAVKPGKPSMAVVSKYTEYTLVPETAAELQVTLLSGLGEGQLSAELSASEGVSILSNPLHTFELDGAAELTFPLELAPTAAGKHNILIRLQHTGTQTRFPNKTIKLVLWVGGKSTAVSAKGEAPEKVALPAKETIVE